MQAVAALDHPGLPGAPKSVQLVVDVLVTASVQALRSSQDVDSTAANNKREPLTPREQEVLVLLASGASNAEIAAHLVVTIGTVKAHSRSLFGKLGVANRTQAARIYYLAQRTPANEEPPP